MNFYPMNSEILKDTLISVIMSVYNGEKYVSEALESILNQTHKNIEFIIIDDGSKDKTFEIIKEYASKDKRVKIVKNSINIGLTKSLNHAIRYSKGKFIARQDDDDISLSKRLEIQLDFLQKNPEYGFCGCNGIIKQNKAELLNYFEINEIRKNLIVDNCFAHPSIIIRKEILEKYGYYNESYFYGQDYELWCRLIYKYGILAKNLNEKLIIMNIPIERIKEKNKQKFLIQRKNQIKTKLRYIKYVEKKFSGIKSAIIKILEIYYAILFNKDKK